MCQNMCPRPTKLLIDAPSTTFVKRHVLSAKAGGQWRIDYASVLLE